MSRVNLRLSADEAGELQLAAQRTGETVAGYIARAALAVARGEHGQGVDVEELRAAAYDLMQARSALGRLGGLFNQAVAALSSTGQAPPALPAIAQRCAIVIARTDDAVQAVVKVLGTSVRRRPRPPT